MQQMILGSFDGEWHEVQDPVQAGLLSDPTTRQLLAPFIGAERTLTQAAEAAGTSLQRLTYRVKQFMAAGLLTETRRERRSGRAMRYYRAVADGFYVPFEITPFVDAETMMAHQYAPYDRLRNRASAWSMQRQGNAGRRIYRDAVTGQLNTESNLPFPSENVTWTDTPSDYLVAAVRLTPRQAQTLTREFGALYQRVRETQLPDEQGQLFLVHLGLLLVAPPDQSRPS